MKRRIKITILLLLINICFFSYIYAQSNNSSALNSKIVYDNPKKITTMGTKPPTLESNCKDAIQQSWNKNTLIESDDSFDGDNQNVSSISLGKKVFISCSNQKGNPYSAGGTNEYEQMYKLGQALQKILDNRGYSTKLYYDPAFTNSISKNISEGENWLGNKEGGLYIALHSNAGENTGPITFYYEGDQVSKQFAQAVNDELYLLYKSKGFTGSELGIRSAQGYSPQIQEVMNSGDKVVSILTEVAFHNNKKEAQYIIDNIDGIAIAIADGISSVFDTVSSSSYSGMESSSFKAISSMIDASYETKKSKILQMSDVEALSRVIYGEQGTNSFESQVFVGLSVINRTRTSGWGAGNTIQEKISAENQYHAINGNLFWGDIPQEAVNAAKTAIEAVKKGEYYMQAYKTSSSNSKEKINVISVEAFQANDSKSFFVPTFTDAEGKVWNGMKLRGIVQNTSGFKYTGFYWR